MGNPNHDPKTGEFSEGPGGGNLRDVAKQLEVHLGKDTFSSALQQVTAGKTADELKQIAKEFSGVRSTSGKDAIKNIVNRHQSLMTFIKKSAATGGRSAG